MCGVAIILWLLAGVASSVMTAAHFPSVSGSNLNGRNFALPADFHAPLNLVFVAYKREQQSEVDSWKAAADQAKTLHPDLAVWELPTLSRRDGLFRAFIDGGMRRGIPDAATRAVTITLYIDKRPFNAALHIATEATITVLLVRPDGNVVWRTAGAFSTEAGAALQTALDHTPGN